MENWKFVPHKRGESSIDRHEDREIDTLTRFRCRFFAGSTSVRSNRKSYRRQQEEIAKRDGRIGVRCVSGERVGVSHCRSDAISIRGIERLTSDWRPSGWHTHLCQRKRNESSLRRLHVYGDLERQEAKSHRLRSVGPCQKSIHGVSEKFQGRVKRRE